MTENKKNAYMVTLLIVSVYFSLLENMIPKPFPWMKIGLANIATVIAMNKFGIKFGMELVVLRIVISSFMAGMLFSPNFIMSFTAGMISAGVMAGLFMLKEKLSLVAISTMGGFIHNAAQLLAAYLLFFRNISFTDRGVVGFVLIFSLIGALSGTAIGVLSVKFKI